MSSSDSNLVSKKIVVIGDSNAGKTSIIFRYANGTFDPNCSTTIGTSFVLKHLPEYGEDKAFKIWDTAGQERYRSVVPMYLRNANAVLFVFDITNKHITESIEVWVDFIQNNVDSHVPIFAVGNKLDLLTNTRALSEASSALSVHSLRPVYTSAKTGQGVGELFDGVARLLFGDAAPAAERAPALLPGDEPRERCC